MWHSLWVKIFVDGFLGGIAGGVLRAVGGWLVKVWLQHRRFMSDGMIRRYFHEHYPFYTLPVETQFFTVSEWRFYRWAKKTRGKPEELFQKLAGPTGKSGED